MARGQQRGGLTALHVWLIAFVALWLVSTVLLVWLYTDQTGLTKTADDLRADNQTRQTELSNLRNRFQELATLATGSAEDDLATARTKAADMFQRIRDDGFVPDPNAFHDADMGLHPAMTTLYAAYRAEHQARATAEQNMADLSATVDQLNAEKQALSDAYQTKQAELTQKVAELEADRDQYRADRDSQVDGFDERLKNLRDTHLQEMSELIALKDSLERDLKENKSRMADLQAMLGELQMKPPTLLTLRQGDGEIVLAEPGEEVVYINLGKRHGITRGMQFAVYSSSVGIPESGMPTARIEVARVFEDSSECIIREEYSANRIVIHDLINNPIYDKDRSLQFVVAGEFDIDGDGSNDPDGREQIEALINAWGGQVVNKVTARVDFVVLGDAPPTPSTGRDIGELSDRSAAAREAYDEYQAALEAAQGLSVQILSQHLFLNYLGFAR